MIAIKELISSLSEKEQTAFVNYLKQRNKRKDARNVALFNALNKGNEIRLKTEIGSNAYHALKKRLSDQLIEFTANMALSKELNVESQVIKLITVARKMFIEGHSNLAFTLLGRAEKKALELDNYSMLNEIYHTMIEYSHQQEKLDLAALFTKLEKNNRAFLAHERLITFYSAMQGLFSSKKFQQLPSSFHQTYKENCQRFGIKDELTFNFRSLHQLCILADLYGSQTKNYHDLDLFFEVNITKLQSSERDTIKTLPYQLELLYAMANIYFRKKDPIKSRYYLDQLKEQMHRYEGRYLAKWKARYNNLLALHLNFTSNPKEALETAMQALFDPGINESDACLLSLTCSMIHFQQGELQEVKRILQRLQHNDAWYLKHVGNEWLFNYKAMEVLLHFDLGNDLLAYSLIQSFERKYAIHFRRDKQNPIWPFLQLIKVICKDPIQLYSAEFAQKIENAIPWKGESEDLFNMCFYAWLKARTAKQDVYETTLDLLGFNKDG